MKVKLADNAVSGAPLYECLEMADKFLEECKSITSWYDVFKANRPDDLLQGLRDIMGHPLNRPVVPENIDNFSRFLAERGENVLAYLVEALRLDLTPEMVRYTMVFILVNGDLLKQRENKKLRSIDDAWELD